MISWIVTGTVWEMRAIAVLTSQIQIRYIIRRQSNIPHNTGLFFLFLCINTYIQSSFPQSDIDNDLVGDSCDTNQDRYEKVHHSCNRDATWFPLHISFFIVTPKL